MRPAWTLAFSGKAHDEVKRHLFPGDGLEAAAILVCTRAPGPRQKLLVRDTILVPYDTCTRQLDAITWSGAFLEKAIDLGEAQTLCLILIHSHPGGLLGFSKKDDDSDRATMPSVFAAFGDLHGTAVMVPSGAVKARLYAPALTPMPVDLVTVAGDDISFFWDRGGDVPRPMAFTGAMTAELARLSAVVIGASGTGSITLEQSGRLGFGRVTGIDFDRVETRNLNRILNATTDDAVKELLKTDVFARAMTLYRGEGVAIPIAASIATRDAVLEASQADVVLCCVDSHEGRQMADLIAAAFLMPLIDVGVVIPVRKTESGFAIADVCGRVDYVQPGGATLMDREVYSAASLRAEYLRHVAPEAHQEEVAAGYIRGMAEQAPSVITLNMRAAAAGVNEFIARAYPYRLDHNRRYARTLFSLAACEEEYVCEDDFARAPNPVIARGDQEPLLGLPALTAPRRAAA